ncbi:MipA/OmpV family protein [Elioraea thermophila]|uniref:MipA/OmpV family protein n=1 Tax=Elioraea thermophila TaxID=2185104 RepID=UPI000DF3CDFF|nr:MipA/OmpV family protein [Elioraea thermophila]
MTPRPLRLLTALVAAAIASVAQAQAPDRGTAPAVGIGAEPGFLGPGWRVSLGAGALVRPDYPGSSDYDVTPIPFLEVVWNDRVFATTRQGAEIGVFLTRDRLFRSGIALDYAFGRDQDDNARLKGLGDIDGTVRGRAFASTGIGPFTLSAFVTQDLANNGHGLTLGADLEYRARLTPRLSVFGGPGVTWADDTHMETFFGVSPAQAARSAARLPRYDARAGFRDVRFTLGAIALITDSTFLQPRVIVSQLVGDAADSPLTTSETQVTAFLIGGIRF